ncbi:putative rab-interacting lysosomal protein [Diachasmimorpha longicaudata entomopoxvirus]|uniref:Putative rab-interacting lysosomal protein n=1 Tax=Diachasmimorpha longicaudata entomopoxvirus TaxID=109981 RepID=A0A7R5WK21_9POXV|nr:putative rab-interacting lysosomal protein [Diachasmimorpha longicaudata entomopoxvirus]AKS26371.1 putative rab-interacting lysosomal protein [Diachasmimorpha longicaudata entomopoxvirus]
MDLSSGLRTLLVIIIIVIIIFVTNSYCNQKKENKEADSPKFVMDSNFLTHLSIHTSLEKKIIELEDELQKYKKSNNLDKSEESDIPSPKPKSKSKTKKASSSDDSVKISDESK